MLNVFRDGFWAFPQHFQGRSDLDAVDGLKAGMAIRSVVGAMWRVGLRLFPLL
jgi:hypothetical protein